MASTIMCHFCEGAEPAQLIVTVQANGETVGVGPSCLPTWGLVVAGVDPSLIDKVLDEAYAQQAADAAETPEADQQSAAAGEDAPPEPSTPPRAARRRTKPKETGVEQEARVREELAERPDSATTSPRDIPADRDHDTHRRVDLGDDPDGDIAGYDGAP